MMEQWPGDYGEGGRRAEVNKIGVGEAGLWRPGRRGGVVMLGVKVEGDPGEVVR